jgi:uncharacterized protein YaiI (UPF0178 family)
MTRILVDADACPVKPEIYKVAYRTKTPVVLVSNSYLRLPDHPLVTQRVVSDGFDAADDALVEMCVPADVVITADILLAQRVLEAGAAAIDPRGVEFTTASIGGAVATRAIMADVRAGLEGLTAGGPKTFSARDRSSFLNGLDRILVRLQRAS